jgi:hypothetical protein
MPDTPTTTQHEDLPADYPFILDDALDSPPFTGALSDGAAMIYMNARDYARMGLRAEDFTLDGVDEEPTVNDELAELRTAAVKLTETLATPGPWHGIDFDGDVCVQAAQLSVLLNKLLVPLHGLEDHLVRAGVNARFRRDPAATRREVQASEFADTVAMLAMGVDTTVDPELRLARLTELAGHVEVHRGRVAADAVQARRGDTTGDDNA